jgi:hypothetical protein
MPRPKPAGWPELMTAKRLSTGVTAYYWAPPTRAKKAGYEVTSEALGNDYGEAKKRCDDVLIVRQLHRQSRTPASLRGVGYMVYANAARQAVQINFDHRASELAAAPMPVAHQSSGRNGCSVKAKAGCLCRL